MSNYGYYGAGNQRIEIATVLGATATFENNYANGAGGAIYMFNTSRNGNAGEQYLTINGSSTFTGNSADASGGAIYMHN